jgi:hypothetical protein
MCCDARYELKGQACNHCPLHEAGGELARGRGGAALPQMLQQDGCRGAQDRNCPPQQQAKACSC